MPRSPGAAPANADELLWTERYVDEGRERVTMPATGVRLDGISLRRNLISSQARVRENAIERLARIGYPALTSGTAWRGGEAATVEEAVRIGLNGGLCGRRVKE